MFTGEDDDEEEDDKNSSFTLMGRGMGRPLVRFAMLFLSESASTFIHLSHEI